MSDNSQSILLGADKWWMKNCHANYFTHLDACTAFASILRALTRGTTYFCHSSGNVSHQSDVSYNNHIFVPPLAVAMRTKLGIYFH